MRRGCDGSSALHTSLKMAPHFYGSPSFFQEHSWLQSSSLPSPQAVCMQSTAVLSPGPLSKPHIPAPNPCQHWWTPILGWGMQSCGTGHLCKSCSVLPATDQLLHFPPVVPEAPLLSQLISLLVRGLLQVWELLLSFSSPAVVWVPPCFLFSFSSFTLFCPTWLFGDLFLSF